VEKKLAKQEKTKVVVVGSMGYWHQSADENHGNPPPR